MTSIGRTDQILLRLREQLQRRSRASGANQAAPASRASATPIERLRANNAAQSINDDENRRIFIRALLTEEFGDAVGNEPEFARIVDDVWHLLGRDVETRRLLDRAIDQLRSGA